MYLVTLTTFRCVCRFTSHVNQSHPISAAISPCARFIATGSEDRAVYIYDIRYPSPLHKLTGHSDVVSTLAYHPLRPMVCGDCLTLALFIINTAFSLHYSLLLQHWMAKSVSYQINDSDNTSCHSFSLLFYINTA